VGTTLGGRQVLAAGKILFTRREIFLYRICAMEIYVEVIDGIHGKPAEGVAVSFVSSPGGIEVEREDQRTDQLGRVSYAGRRIGMAGGETYSIEIDAHIYFGTLGIDFWQRKVAVFFQPADPDEEYYITSLITPYMQSTFCVRQSGARRR
jgi:5-hydroxyisourate hydrolase-like protein (transthyretin family)